MPAQVNTTEIKRTYDELNSLVSSFNKQVVAHNIKIADKTTWVNNS